MVTNLFTGGRTAPTRRATFVPVADRASAPDVAAFVIAAAITVSVGAAGAILPLIL